MTPKLYKAADVCESTGLQPYVLRSWEKEFPGIGVQRSQDSPRLYRQSDLEQVLRIKELVFGEGLTLAGARRRLEETSPRRAESREAQTAEVLDTLGADARERIALVRGGLRSMLDVLSRTPGSSQLPELRRAEPLVDRRGGPSPNGRGRGGPSGPPKTRSSAARGKSSPSKRVVAVKRGSKKKGARA